MKKTKINYDEMADIAAEEVDKINEYLLKNYNAECYNLEDWWDFQEELEESDGIHLTLLNKLYGDTDKLDTLRQFVNENQLRDNDLKMVKENLKELIPLSYFEEVNRAYDDYNLNYGEKNDEGHPYWENSLKEFAEIYKEALDIKNAIDQM